MTFAAALTFVTPAGALIGAGAVLVVAALAVSVERAARAARILGLTPASRRRRALPAAIGACACAFVAMAAAQPALRTTHRQTVRARSEAFFVVDVSRSMAAASSVGAPTRLARARAVVARLRAAVPDVPSGLAGLTDRVLPYLFPTADAAAFAETLRRSVTIESPPPQQVSTNATTFEALTSLARNGFFDRQAERRTCVLVSDGESRSYSAATVAEALDGPSGCRLVIVRVGEVDQHVFAAGGVPEAGYAADPAAAGKAAQLAEATGGRAFGEGDLAGATTALRDAAEAGPVQRAAISETTRSLAPYAALAALVLTVALVAFRLPGRRLPTIRTFT